ncbi:hypothetical protein NKK48_30245 [Mesorhizobium sp. C386A]|uniref:hypothetical protein n=1 Tax=unclassified Mesorhizobium TaxID=325217 RepID=UPI0003CF310C|nr:hypothetical protein [Mesorhizobium sp. LNJC386A00]ESY35717.1 hypothetical protein X748_13960 [Mesorhizobium sp. LNJC386A00]
MTTRQLSESDLQSLSNICEAAADRFKDNAINLREWKHPYLAEQFERQEKEAREFSSLFMNSEPFEVSYESA